MDQSDASFVRPRRKRVERGKRSKDGCRTCISKRVKCDEQRPFCGRCIRLRLVCEWAPPRPPLASRRRGFGPIKHRDSESWTPPPILPDLEVVDRLLESCSSWQQSGLGPPILDKGKQERIDTPINPRTHGLESAMGNLPGRLPLAFRDYSLVGPLESPSAIMSLRTPEQREDELQETTPVLANQRPQGTVAGASTSQEFYMPHVPAVDYLSESLPLLFMSCTRSIPIAGTDDMQALSFHRTVFGPLKSTRTPANSAHSIFVNCAIDKQMALHFLLAVAHCELSLYYGTGLDLPRESYLHFDQGSQLLRHALAPRGPTDHITFLLSFLYMFMFMMRSDQPAPQKLRELSRVVVDYVQNHNVDEFCINEDVNIFSQDSSAGLLIPDQVLLARIFTYLYDRDGFCSFFGCGGSFATFVNGDASKRRKIWTLSRTVFLFSKESDLSSGTISEIQDAVVLDLYFTLIAVHHEINLYSQTGNISTCGDERRLKQHLDQLREEHSSVFSLVIDNVSQGAAPSLMACVAVTIFFALQIYLHRSRRSAFGAGPLCHEVRSALSSLVTAAYNTVTTGPVLLLERFQWSLFIGGIETHDPVHREWIATHLSDPALKKAFRLVQEEKMNSLVTMQSLRRMIGGE